jgi:hypothetical protein
MTQITQPQRNCPTSYHLFPNLGLKDVIEQAKVVLHSKGAAHKDKGMQ